MNSFLSAAMALAGAAVAALAAGCSAPSRFDSGLHESGWQDVGTPSAPFDSGPHDSGWQDVGTPSRPAAVDRVARYRADENGVLRDDSGRKYEAVL